MRGLSDLDVPRRPRRPKSSRPRPEDGCYLDLYILQRERSRLCKESSYLEKRKREIGRRLEEIEEEMKSLRNLAKRANPEGGRGKGQTLPVLPLEY